MGYTGYNGSAIHAVFRGTIFTSLENWINNLKFAKRRAYPKIPNAEVMDGFDDDYNSVQPLVIAQIKALMAKYPGKRVYVTGHSLGAALAVLCAMDLHFMGINVSKVYTYGCPRVGNSAFADAFQLYFGDSWRLTHWRDVVPHLPLVAMGFWHVAREVWYNSAFSNYTVCNGSGEDPECSDSLIDYSVRDHLDYFNFTSCN